jgi:3',5'-cyclic AMP phosphodiesterase CpdA
MLLAHFSDVHVTSPVLGWRLADYFNKRLTGWINLHVLGRAKHFGQASEILRELASDLDVQQPAHLIFSGDATGLGFDSEMAVASQILSVGRPHCLSGMAVPGNHDYYTPSAVESGSFERHFEPWQQGERIDQERYPFAQRAGNFWLVGVNSSTANRGIFDASGAAGPAQLERLRTLLDRLTPEPRILVTHYPVVLANGKLEKRLHGMRDLPAMLEIARARGVCLWLHGHRHQAYRLPNPPGANFPVICAGSATQHGRASYGLYVVDGKHLQGCRRQFNPRLHAFEDVERFELQLGC